MKLTRDQIMKKQAQTPDGWRYDWQYAVIHGEHTMTRRVDIDGTHFLEARLCYCAEKGANPWQTTGRQIPTLHVSRYQDKGSVYVSHGLGKWLTIGEPEKNKNYKALCKYADGITDEMLMEIYNADRNLLDEGRPLFA